MQNEVQKCSEKMLEVDGNVKLLEKFIKSIKEKIEKARSLKSSVKQSKEDLLAVQENLETFQEDTLSLESLSWLMGYYNNYNWQLILSVTIS